MTTNNSNLSSKRKKLIILSLVLALLASLAIVTAVGAEVILLGVLNAWDDGTSNWTNGNAQYNLDGNPQAFYQPLTFDNAEVVACTGGGTTKWAGEIRLDHDSEYKNGALGYQSTGEWHMASCAELAAGAEVPTSLGTCVDLTGSPPPEQIGSCEILIKDEEVAIGTAGEKEIQSVIRGSLDQDCDGFIDDPDFDPPTDLCFYWQAMGPTPAQADIGGGWPADQLQSSITDGGGEKTVQTKFSGPAAVTLAGMSAEVGGVNLASVGLLFILVGGAFVGFLLHRRHRLN